MKPVEHIAADQALKANAAASAGDSSGQGPRRRSMPPSTANRITTAILWLVAIGSLVAMFLRR